MRLRSTLIALASALTLSSTAFAGVITSTDDARAAAAHITQPAAASIQRQATPLRVTSTDEARRVHEVEQQMRASGFAPALRQHAAAPLHVTSTDEARVAARLL